MELNLEEFTGLLFRDVKSNYDPDNIHRDKLFFSTDTKELLLNGESYGKNNVFVLNDIGLLSNESGQRIKEIIGSFKDVIQAITDKKVFITIMGVGITPVIVKQQSAKVSFTVFYYDTYNTSQIKHRTLIINSDGTEWTNIESIIDDEIIRISDLNLNYNRENKIISIKKENNDIITQIDATDFIKDGMINTVELIENPDGRPVGTYLVITFNTDAGKEPIYLDITTLIGIYTAGQGIDISNNTISIKIDPSSENYIFVTKNGLKIVGIDEKLNFTPITKINKLIGEIQITNELEHDKQELFDLFGVTDVNGLFSLSPETTDKYFEDVEGNRLKYFISGGMGGGTLTISYENVIYNDSILSDVILISASKDNYGLYNKITSITNSKKESNITFYYVGDIFSLSISSTSAEIEKVLGSVNDFTNAYKNGKLIVCRTNISKTANNSTISPILFQDYEDNIKIKMIYAGLGYNPSSPDDCIEIMLNKSSNTWRVTNVIKQKLNDYSDIQNKVNSLENECNELQSLKSTGILWSNLFVGADMEKGYTESNIPGFSTYPSLGGTIERVLDYETSRYCIKGYFPEGTNFNEFAYPKLFNDINFVGENTTQEFSISFRYKCTSNLQNIHLLCNNSFMEYTDINGTPISKMPLIKDNNWHYVHVIAKKSGVTNKNYTIGLYIYFSGTGSNTLTSNLEFYITDIVISTSKFPDYAVVRNVNDYITPVNKETIKPVVNEIINEYPDIHNCVFMSLGDSITTEGYYIDKLRQLISPSKYYNLAVSGAHWADYVNTIYDGNPVFGGDNVNNTLGNQVQKIINNPDVYNTAPDVIIIAAGTNDTTPITADKTDYEMRVEIDSHFNENSTTPIQVTEPTFDESDTYKEHRRTIAGAMRYCILKLQSLYPNAKIYILTPIQGSYNPNKDYLTQIEIKQRYITEVAKHLSVPVIHVGEECGINRDFEYGGTYWEEEWDTNNNKTGRDLVDGLHPNTNGSWKMAKYIYNKLKNDYIE